jgi:type I restriction enzyme M protein
VYRANTLDPRGWDVETREGLKNRLLRFPDDSHRDLWNREHFRFFDFDVLMTNPPFAGDIQDSRILHQFDLAKKPDGRWQTKVGRDVLFIQRNLEFLRPGGRMAIVLPQGRLNNSTDKYIRDFLVDQVRILAVIGLHGDTFKPHTGTKTSILFLQKWNDDPSAPPRLRCPRIDDFATSHNGGKDTSGEYVYLTDDKGRRLCDLHGHPIVDHDLFNLRASLDDQVAQRLAVADEREKQVIRDAWAAKAPFVPKRPGIADAFREWGGKQNFAFCLDEADGA